jgi:hypothetical protein
MRILNSFVKECAFEPAAEKVFVTLQFKPEGEHDGTFRMAIGLNECEELSTALTRAMLSQGRTHNEFIEIP